MGVVMSLIGWAIFGLIVGAIGRALFPGKQAMSWLQTMGLGVAGSFVGGFISWGFGFSPEAGPLRGGGWIMSVVGALLVVWLGLYLTKHKGPPTPLPPA